MLEAILYGLTLFAVGLAVYVIAVLTIDYLTEWFDNYQSSNTVDFDDVGFTIKESLKKGDVKVIQGVFNKNSGTVKDARRIEAENVDKNTRIQLGKEKLTIFS